MLQAATFIAKRVENAWSIAIHLPRTSSGRGISVRVSPGAWGATTLDALANQHRAVPPHSHGLDRPQVAAVGLESGGVPTYRFPPALALCATLLVGA